MPETLYRNRRAVQIESDALRVTVLVEGGHIAEIQDKQSGVNPLWTPPWPSIEPSSYSCDRHPEYGGDAESKLLAGLMGHNLALDSFGSPSPEEAAAGLGVHGQASIVPWEIEAKQNSLVAKAVLPAAQLAVERELKFVVDNVLSVTETVENLAITDRPIAWAEHVSLGPPFLERGVTEFAVPATRAKTLEVDYEHNYVAPNAEFTWPHAPRKGGGNVDLRVFNSAPVSAAFTTQMMDPASEHAFFAAYSPTFKIALVYSWLRSDFPWLGIWEENHARRTPPWNGNTLVRGMEFSASPFPEPRRKMISRNGMFGEQGYRWIPAKSRASVNYTVFVGKADSIPKPR